MAKRRRLTPAQSDYLADYPVAEPEPGLPQLEVKAHLRPGFAPALPSAPIAQVAGQAAATAALQELSDAVASARTEGRLVQRLPLETIDPSHLVRDRMETNEEELGHLMASIREHGQRTPIEVTEIAPGRYGLISGWRRLTALHRLAAETGEDRFQSVLALQRRPETAGAAYVAMVEENEVRLGLSYYERARIAAKAVDLGVFETEKSALQRLYAAASRAKRSKIGSFLSIYRRLDGVLRFPSTISERLGLALAQIVESDPARLESLIKDLTMRPAPHPLAEQLRLTAFIKHQAPERRKETVLSLDPPPAPTVAGPAGSQVNLEELRPGVFLKVEGGWTKPVLILSGPGVDPEFRERLTAWVQTGR